MVIFLLLRCIIIAQINAVLMAVILKSAHHLDVVNAVDKGVFSSGLDHYTKKGSKEGRIWSCQSRHTNTDEDTKDV
jgi:hypothetical protein